MSAFDSELLTAEDLWRRLRDIEDALLQIESGRGAPVLFGKPVGLGEPQDGDLVRFNAAENGWLPWSPKYMTARLSANQTSPSTNDHVEFNTVAADSGHVTLSTGSGQANGIFTLPEGKWRIWATVGATFTASGGLANLQFRDHPGGSPLDHGRSFLLFPMGSSNLGSPVVAQEVVVVVPSSLDLKLEITSASSLDSLRQFSTSISIFALA